MQWGPVTNSYNAFTCDVACKNAVHSCPVLICEAYTAPAGDDTKPAGQQKVVVEAVEIPKALK